MAEIAIILSGFCIQGVSDIFVMASLVTRPAGYFCSYYIYIILIPLVYNVLCNARNCFTISLWSPWRQEGPGLHQEFSRKRKIREQKSEQIWEAGNDSG